MPTLLPCPFCGSPGTIKGSDTAKFWAACTSQDCVCAVGQSGTTSMEEDAGIYSTPKEAAADWNKRHNPYKIAFHAAKAFIEGHIADPDLNAEMCKTYATYQKALQDLPHAKTPETLVAV